MCGIAGGFVRMPGARTAHAEAMATAMAAAMAHRGPDGGGVASLSYAEWRGALSHRRLAVIDLSPDGQQPMTDADSGICLTFNGELYNYRALRRTLESFGHRFRTHTDTEVLLQAYLQWGAAALAHCDGMFAFALWDPREGRLLLARDRFGIKPLYLWQHPGEALVFASEVRAVLASGLVPRVLDLAALPGYLETGSVVSPATLIQGVRSLAPGHYATWHDGVLTETPYWRLADALGGAAPTRAAFAETLREAVTAEMVSDVPIGVFLSGGIDSSALVSLLSTGGESLHTVSLAFEDAALDERLHARAVATHFGTTHHEIEISAAHVTDTLPHLAQWQDLPSVDGLNTLLVSRAAREAGLTVALSGLGGDELFAGYDSFRYAEQWGVAGPALRALPLRQMIAHAGAGALGGRFAKALRVLGDAATIEDLYGISREILPPSVRRALLRTSTDAPSASAAPLHGPVGLHPVNAMTLLESGRYLLDTTLRQADIMSMAVSLEVRVPLLNHRVAEMAIRTPIAWRLQRGTPKPLLLAALPRALPSSIVHRRKGTFSLPYATWLRGPYRAVAEDLLLSSRTQARGLFDPVAVRRLWESFVEGRTGWSGVWALASLEGWCRATLDVSPLDTPAVAMSLPTPPALL